MSTESTTDFSDMVGVYRDRSDAEQAVSDLKQAGFPEDHIDVTEYELQGLASAITAVPSLESSNKRIIVHVKAPGREQEAVGIMTQHGANNADIPVGTKLVHGTLVGTNIESADLVPGEANEAASSDDLFETTSAPGQPGETTEQDSPDMPRA